MLRLNCWALLIQGNRCIHLGKPEDGVLYGDLIIKGSGDPVFSQKELWLFIRQIQDAGVRDIRGNVILDRSVFKTGSFDAAAFDAEPLKPYNAGPDALLLNEKKIDVRLVPNESENTVKVVFEPRLDGVKITPPLLSNGECGNWKKDIVLQFDDRHANFDGIYSSTCQEKIWSVLPYQMSNTRYFESVFSTLWKEAGGRFKGRFGRRHIAAGGIKNCRVAFSGTVFRCVNRKQTQQQCHGTPVVAGYRASRIG